jgi:ABC-type transport system substrate-binding protein
MENKKMNKNYRIALSLVVIFAISVFSGCVGESEKHEELIIQLDTDVVFLDIRDPNAASGYDVEVFHQWSGYLMQLAPGEDTAVMPGVAESWEVTNPATENETWTFTIRDDAKFHDGTEIKAKDVAYSMWADRYITWAYDNVSEAKADYEGDGYNVTFPASDPNGDGKVVTFSGAWFPDPTFAYGHAGQYWGNEMLVPYGSHGLYTDNNDSCMAKYEQWLEAPISAGPLKYSDRAEEDYVLLERFDEWYGWGETFTSTMGKSYTFPALSDAFKTVRYRVIEDNAMALVELRTGGIDAIAGFFLSKDALIETNNTDGFKGWLTDTLTNYAITMNIEGDWPTFFGGPGNFPLSEPWFRKAVSHVVNRTNMVNNVKLGLAKAKTNIFSDKSLQDFPGIDTSDYYDYAQGLEEAEAILDAMGYVPGKFSSEPTNRFGFGVYANETQIDGVNQTKGRHFTAVTDDRAERVNMALAIKKDLAQIGIILDVEILEWGSFLSAIRTEPDTGFDYNDTYVGVPDPDFTGPDWDFSIGASGGWLDVPHQDVGFFSYVYYMYFGYSETSWFNIDYEIAYAKFSDGEGFLWMDWPGGPSDWPYPVPEYKPDNEQYVEACEDAGWLVHEYLPRIPLMSASDVYLMNEKLNNFIGSMGGHYHAAYSYWA